jgi:preprotein translocase subunit SecF
MLKELFYIYLVVCSSYCTTEIICFGVGKVDRYISKRKPVEVKIEIVEVNNEEVFEKINNYKYESDKEREEYQKESIKSSKELRKKADELNKAVEEFVNECEESRKTGGNK